jgi:hypothetical protein
MKHLAFGNDDLRRPAVVPKSRECVEGWGMLICDNMPGEEVMVPIKIKRR